MSTSWGFHKLSPVNDQEKSQLLRQPLVHRSSFQCKYARVCRPRLTYRRNDLLGLPLEVRQSIWQAIFEDIWNEPNGKWYERAVTRYDGLHLTCRQIWFEIAEYWPRTIIPRNRLDVFFDQTYNATALSTFRSLNIEIPFDSPISYFNSTATALRKLAHVLQDLRLFFVGEDKYGVKTYIHGCGSREPTVSSTSRKLLIEGQGHQERQPIFEAVALLWQLKSLVLSNCQYPLLQSMLLAHKPKLEKLRIATDPRQTVHKELDCSSLRGLIMPPAQNFAPVKELYICANAGLTSLQIASKVCLTLEHMTWVVPDCSRQAAGGMPVNWYQDTSMLLDNLHRNARRLETLRLCFEGSTYEGHPAYGSFMGGIRLYLLHLPIKVLEMHVHSKSPWHGKEVVEFMPDSVTRFYASEKMLSVKDLQDVVEHRYLSDDTVAAWRSEVNTPTTKLRHYHHVGIVGEELSRKDSIPFIGGRLGFVGFEYSGHSYEDTIILLRLNGRLLDRERNSHMSVRNGRHIPSQLEEKQVVGESSVEEVRDRRIEFFEGKEATDGPSKKETWAALDQLRMSQFRDDKRYFGEEKKAQEFFEREKVAKAEDLPLLRWIEDVEVEEHAHWLSD